MPDSRSQLNSSFAETIKAAYTELKLEYSKGMNEHPDRNESSRRAGGKTACDLFLNQRSRFSEDVLGRGSPVLFRILPRYLDFLQKHYSMSEYRFAEWFDSDWRAYLRDEFHYDHPPYPIESVSKDVLAAANLPRKEVMEFLAYELAFRLIKQEHIAALNPKNESTVESEPEHFVAENQQERRAGAFDRWQSTAFIVTLIDALTNHSLELSTYSGETTQQANIHSLNVTKLAEAISLVTGLSAHNIKKDIYQWRSQTASDNDGRLKKVRESLLSFGVEVNTTILDEAIDRPKK